MSEATADVKAAHLKDWRFSIDGENIAWAVFDREGESANSLGRRPIEELDAIIERVEAEARAKTVRGLVILSGKERGFIEYRYSNSVGFHASPDQVTTGQFNTYQIAGNKHTKLPFYFSTPDHRASIRSTDSTVADLLRISTCSQG